MTVPFQARHLLMMRAKEEVLALLDGPNAAGALEMLSEEGNCETILTDDGKTVLAIMGAVPESGNTCEVFVFASEDQKRYPLTFARAVKFRLNLLRRQFRVVKALSRDTGALRKWLEWLGFRCSGQAVYRAEFNGSSMLVWEVAGYGC